MNKSVVYEAEMGWLLISHFNLILYIICWLLTA